MPSPRLRAALGLILSSSPWICQRSTGVGLCRHRVSRDQLPLDSRLVLFQQLVQNIPPFMDFAPSKTYSRGAEKSSPRRARSSSNSRTTVVLSVAPSRKPKNRLFPIMGEVSTKRGDRYT